MAHTLDALCIALHSFPTSAPARITRTMFAAERDIMKALVQDPKSARKAEKFREPDGEENPRAIIFEILEHYRLKSSRTTDLLYWEPPD